MVSPARLLCFTVLLMSTGISATAQTQLLVTRAVGAVVKFDLDRQQVIWRIPDVFPDRAILTSDGRFALWTSFSYDRFINSVAIRDGVTGTVLRYVVERYGPTERLLAHPRRLQVFALGSGPPIHVFDLSGVRTIDRCSAPADMSLTLDGSQLFILCGEHVVVVATDTQRNSNGAVGPLGRLHLGECRRIAIYHAPRQLDLHGY